MRISKKVREEAAWVASVAACRGNLFGESSFDINDVGASPRAMQLYWSAWTAINDARLTRPGHPLRSLMYSDRILDAEAEALIRTGWSPGDEP